MEHWSAYSVPLGAFALTLGIVVSFVIAQAHARRLKADQRIAMVQRGLRVEEIERLLGTREEGDRPARDPVRSLANARRAGILLVSTGLGIMLFFLVLTIILHERDVLSGGAAGLIPFAIGVGFFIDYGLQKREMSRFGLEVGADLPGGGRLR